MFVNGDIYSGYFWIDEDHRVWHRAISIDTGLQYDTMEKPLFVVPLIPVCPSFVYNN